MAALPLSVQNGASLVFPPNAPTGSSADVTSGAAMSARKALQLAERRARTARPLPRPPLKIGQWRVQRGFAPSTSGYGPLRDLPDWSFADGRPAPLWRGQQRRLRENEEMARRAVKLSRALEAAASRTSTNQSKPV